MLVRGAAPTVTQAVVLAGGFGTRLGSLTQSTPKPLLDVAGRPFLETVIHWLARFGIEEIILSTGYLAQAFEDFVAAHSWRDCYGGRVRVRTFVEREPAGTAGALRLMREVLHSKFLLINGDSFFDCNLAATLAAAASMPEDGGFLTVRQVEDAGRFGRIEIENGRITSFAEKLGEGAGLINAGVTVLGKKVVDQIARVPCSIEKEIYPVLSAAGLLGATVQDGYFIDIGLPETLALAQRELPKVRSKAAVFLDRDGVLNVDKAYVHRTEDFEWRPGAIEAVRLIGEVGRLAIVVTNQAGVARGYYGEDDVRALHRAMNAKLLDYGACIHAFYYAPYHPEGTVDAYRKVHEDRKPGAGMLNRAARDYEIDMGRSFLIGDQESDLAAAAAAGVPGYHVGHHNLAELVRRQLASC